MFDGLIAPEKSVPDGQDNMTAILIRVKDRRVEKWFGESQDDLLGILGKKNKSKVNLLLS